MISEFQALSDKIDLLAEMSVSLRRENAVLRQSSAVLRAENAAYQQLVTEAQDRITALLENLPATTTTDNEAAP